MAGLFDFLFSQGTPSAGATVPGVMNGQSVGQMQMAPQMQGQGLLHGMDPNKIAQAGQAMMDPQQQAQAAPQSDPLTEALQRLRMAQQQRQQMLGP